MSTALLAEAGETGYEPRIASIDPSKGGDGVAATADVLLFRCATFRSLEADIIRKASRNAPHAKILVIVESNDAGPVRLALEAGASGVISSTTDERGLRAAVEALFSGHLCLPDAYRRQVAKPTFTTREKQILGLVVMGLSNGEIGRKLYLAESTVKSHLSSAFNKLGVRSRNEATALILDPSSGLGPGILRISDDLPGTRRLSLS